LLVRWPRAAMSLALAAGAVLLGGAPASAAADTAPPTVDTVTVSPDDVSVSGLDTVPVTFSVHLTDQTGVEPTFTMEQMRSPWIELKKGTTGFAVEVSLSSGTVQDGVWSATQRVPSTWNGTWQVDKVVAYDSVGNRADVAPASPVALTVHGSHIPAIEMTFVPDPVTDGAPLTVRGRLYDTDTRAGIGSTAITFGFDNTCVENIGGARETTGADGTFSHLYPTGDQWLHCAGIPLPTPNSTGPTWLVVNSAFPRIRPVVTIRASAAAVAPGAKFTVSGTVSLTPDAIALQIREGSRWRTIRSVKPGPVKDSYPYRFTVTAPDTGGTREYRVVAPHNADPAQMGVSPVVTVRVGAASGGSGGLPITGPATGAITAVAAGLLFAGLVLVRVTRRRRFVAGG
jgi:hypothetical protein